MAGLLVMATRILTFHHKEGGRLGATYYIEADYTPVAVRVNAERVSRGDTKIDIYDDGVSIFGNKAISYPSIVTGEVTIPTPDTAVVLSAGFNSEEHAEDFSVDIDGESVIIEKGSWVHCTLDGDEANNISVQLELHTGDEELTEEE